VVAAITIARFILSTLLSFWMRQWRMINHISQMLGNQSEVLPRRLTTQLALLVVKKTRNSCLGLFRMGSIDQYFSTVEPAGLRLPVGMRDARAVSCQSVLTDHHIFPTDTSDASRNLDKREFRSFQRKVHGNPPRLSVRTSRDQGRELIKQRH
jgi:hypothetical protein